MNWINVKDRLPEWGKEAKRGHQPFLVFNKDTLTVSVAYLTNQSIETLPGFRIWKTVYESIPLYKVTHWMPLPEPPKE